MPTDLDLTPMEPSQGPPLPKRFNIRWPFGETEKTDLAPMSIEQGPPLPKALGLKWPWKK